MGIPLRVELRKIIVGPPGSSCYHHVRISGTKEFAGVLLQVPTYNVGGDSGAGGLMVLT